MADGCVKEDEIVPVTLFAQNGRVFVWNPDDAYGIRTKHRIVGSLIGSLPRKPRQNVCFSLPLVLTAEETTLLLEKGFAKLVDCSEPFPEPKQEQIETFKERRDASVKDQLEFFRREREEKQAELAEVIKAGRQAKNKKKRKKIAADDNNRTECEPPLKVFRKNDLIDNNVEIREVEHEEKTFKVDKDMKSCEVVLKQQRADDSKNEIVHNEILVHETLNQTLDQEKYGQILTTSLQSETEVKGMDQEEICEQNICDDLSNTDKMAVKPSLKAKRMKDTVMNDSNAQFPEYEVSEQSTFIHIPTSVDSSLIPRKEFKWLYPENNTDRLHYRVFCDLWEKGYFLTSGSKFGGNYLAYPGDPARFHSFFIIVIIPWGKRITPYDIISIGRLGATVKKTAVLCSVNEDDEVIYTSLRWSGMS